MKQEIKDTFTPVAHAIVNLINTAAPRGLLVRRAEEARMRLTEETGLYDSVYLTFERAGGAVCCELTVRLENIWDYTDHRPTDQAGNE
jgi:hypothetical protein